MNIHDFIGTPETQMTDAEVRRRLEAMEMLLGLLFERIEKETGEEVLTQAINTEKGYRYIFGPTRAEKEAFNRKEP